MRQTALRTASLTALLTALTLAAPALAHHSFAMFDTQKEVVLAGTVTAFEWTNPHTWIEMDVADKTGKVTHWSIEGGSPLGLARQGWKRNSILPGDKITLVGRPLEEREESRAAPLMGIVLATGQETEAPASSRRARTRAAPAAHPASPPPHRAARQ